MHRIKQIFNYYLHRLVRYLWCECCLTFESKLINSRNHYLHILWLSHRYNFGKTVFVTSIWSESIFILCVFFFSFCLIRVCGTEWKKEEIPALCRHVLYFSTISRCRFYFLGGCDQKHNVNKWHASDSNKNANSSWHSP